MKHGDPRSEGLGGRLERSPVITKSFNMCIFSWCPSGSAMVVFRTQRMLLVVKLDCILVLGAGRCGRQESESRRAKQIDR